MITVRFVCKKCREWVSVSVPPPKPPPPGMVTKSYKGAVRVKCPEPECGHPQIVELG